MQMLEVQTFALADLYHPSIVIHYLNKLAFTRAYPEMVSWWIDNILDLKKYFYDFVTKDSSDNKYSNNTYATTLFLLLQRIANLEGLSLVNFNAIWEILLFDKYDLLSLLHSPERRYSENFKLEVLEYRKYFSNSDIDTAQHFNISEDTVREFQSEYIET